MLREFCFEETDILHEDVKWVVGYNVHDYDGSRRQHSFLKRMDGALISVSQSQNI